MKTKIKTTNRPQRESAAARSIKNELRQFLDPITLAKINVATNAVLPGSDAYWEIAEPMIRDWLTSRTLYSLENSVEWKLVNLEAAASLGCTLYSLENSVEWKPL